MELFTRRLAARDSVSARLEALEDYVEYLRQQGEYGFSQVGREQDKEEQ